ncbi:MAG: holo-ACP synthase [Coriobacteriales bacterium]|jgi:holo-[acyl-carrier protein] synthase|nr:holo-ACP synthase [Coriobacteriales bacterium]
MPIGVDIVEIPRMQRIIERTPRFLERVFSPAERSYVAHKHKAAQAQHYAAFWAAREATLKALGTGFKGMQLDDVSVGHEESGRPFLILQGQAAARADELGIEDWELSISHTRSVAVANVAGLRQVDRPKPQVEAPDPHEELAREFKRLRRELA